MFLLKIVQMFLVNKNFANIFGPKFCKYFWSKIVQIILVKNCANIFGKKLCKYFWSKIVQIYLVKNCANIFVKNYPNIFFSIVQIFSSAHFGRTLESTLSVRHVMLWTLLNWVICLNIFVLICLNIFVKNYPNTQRPGAGRGFK